MRMILVLCSLLTALALMTGQLAYAAELSPNVSLVNYSISAGSPEKDAPFEQNVITSEPADEIRLEEPLREENEINSLSEQIVQFKTAGLEPPVELVQRLTDLEAASIHRSNAESSLDQGGETCATAAVIPASSNVNYCVTGTMGTTRNCTPPSGARNCYRDVFYSFTPTVSGVYIISMCNSVSDVQYNIYQNTCCASAIFGSADDECSGTDPVSNFTLTAGYHLLYSMRIPIFLCLRRSL